MLEVESFVNIESYEDLVSRKNFVNNLNFLNVDNSQVKILAAYNIGPDKIKCGRSDCHTPHNKGFLIQTPDGLETNVGQVCGKNHFGAIFTTEGNALIKAQREAIKRRKINDILAKEEKVRERAIQLWEQPFGGKWLESSKRNFKKTYPQSTVQQISIRAHRNEPDIFITKRMNSDDDPQLGFRRNDQFESERAGRLHGLPAMGGDVKSLLQYGILRRLEKLVSIPIEQMTFININEFVRWIDELEVTFAKAGLLIDEGKKFFRPKNLAQLSLLVTGTKDEILTKRVIWDYENGSGKILSEGQYKRWLKKQRKHAS